MDSTRDTEFRQRLQKGDWVDQIANQPPQFNKKNISSAQEAEAKAAQWHLTQDFAFMSLASNPVEYAQEVELDEEREEDYTLPNHDRFHHPPSLETEATGPTFSNIVPSLSDADDFVFLTHSDANSSSTGQPSDQASHYSGHGRVEHLLDFDAVQDWINTAGPGHWVWTPLRQSSRTGVVSISRRHSRSQHGRLPRVIEADYVPVGVLDSVAGIVCDIREIGVWCGEEALVYYRHRYPQEVALD